MDFRLSPRLLTTAFLGLALGSSCASPGSEINLGPIFSHHSVPNYDHAEALAGMIRREQRADQTVWAFSPLWWRRTNAQDQILTDFIYPLGRHQHDPLRPHTHTWFLPFFWYEHEPNVDGVMETDWFVLPFIGSNSEDGKENSFGVFPFYAKLENILALDKLDTIMFPFYVRTEQNGRKHTWILWPFIGWREGGGSSGWHLWPIYSHSELENKYRATSVLWPLINFSEEKLDKQKPIKAFHFWPFFGQIKRDDYTANTMLWPLISWAARPSTNYTAWSLWPFLRFEDAPEDGRSFGKIWPFWINFENRNSEWTSLLWPIIWHRRSELGGETREGFWFAPFWRRQLVHQNQVKVAEDWQLWPLLHSKHERDGSYDLSFPAPALPPLFDPDAMARNWGPFYQLWAEHGGADQSWQDQRLIGNLYHAAKSEGHSRWSLPILGGRWQEPDGTKHWSLLAGLIRWSSGPSGKGIETPAFPGPGWPSIN